MDGGNECGNCIQGESLPVGQKLIWNRFFKRYFKNLSVRNYMNATSCTRKLLHGTICNDEFPFHFLKLVKALKNSFQGETAYIPQIERVQIDAIKFERTQIHFLATFSLPLSSSLLQGDVTQYDSKGRFLAFVLC